MKNLKKFIVSFLTLTLLMSVTAFAAPANVSDIKAKLVKAGLPDVYATEIVKYFAENGVTQEKAVEIRDAAVTVDKFVNGRTSADQFTPVEKQQLKGYAAILLSSIGLVAKQVNGKTDIVITNAAGQKLDTISKEEAIKLALAFDVKALFDVLEDVQGDSEFTDSAKEGVLGATEMKQTATNNANVLALGLAVVALAGAAFVVSKKKVMA